MFFNAAYPFWVNSVWSNTYKVLENQCRLFISPCPARVFLKLNGYLGIDRRPSLFALGFKSYKVLENLAGLRMMCR